MKHSCKRVPGNLVFLNEFQERLPMEHWQNGNRTERIENGCRTGTERVRNGYRTDTERIQNGYRTGTGTRAERQQNVFCQAFPVRFLLIGTVPYSERQDKNNFFLKHLCVSWLHVNPKLYVGYVTDRNFLEPRNPCNCKH